MREIERELDEAVCFDPPNSLPILILTSFKEINSRHRNSPVKLRTRAMHRQVDRIYELKEYLHFHTRSFNKLIKLKDALPKHADRDTSNPLWDEMADTVDDLGQFDYYMDSLKERFNNLIELVSPCDLTPFGFAWRLISFRSSTSRMQANQTTHSFFL